ncbi:hypothetical protein B5F40_00745 [Gordonibacter sp. An230]|nr:hypothetical protein B5F40_00745 [Gordonibacter sp. An230]
MVDPLPFVLPFLVSADRLAVTGRLPHCVSRIRCRASRDALSHAAVWRFIAQRACALSLRRTHGAPA